MTRSGIRAVVLGVAGTMALGAAMNAAQQRPSPGETLLGAALHQEEVEGNLEAAIATYRKVVADRTASRAVVARALMRMGLAYEKLGSREATKAYEQLVKSYADAGDLATQARTRLAALNGAPSAAARPVGLLCGDCGDGGGSISRDGRWMVTTEWEAGDLQVRELATGHTQRLMLKTALLKDSAEYAQSPVFSPDGREIAYSWETENGKAPTRTQVRIVAKQRGAKPRILLDDPGIYWAGPSAWSKDGTRLLLEIERVDRTTQLGWVSVSTGAVTIVKSLGWRKANTSRRLSLSPDNRFIVYSAMPVNPAKAPLTQAERDAAIEHIYVLSADGREEVELTTSAHDEQPAWSADGQHLLFISNRTGTRDLWTVPMRDGIVAGAPTMVRRDTGRIESMGITAANVLHYATPSKPFGEVVVVEIDTMGALPAAVRTTERFVGEYPSWSPDGTLLEFSRTSPASEETGSDVIVRSLKSGSEDNYARPGTILRQGPVRWLRDGSGFFQMVSPTPKSTERQWYKVIRNPLSFGPPTAASANRSGVAALSADDKTMYQFTRDSVPGPFKRIVAVDLASGRETTIFELPGPPESHPQPAGVGLSLSPDGRTLALIITNAGTGEAVLSTIGADGTGYRQVFGGFKTPGAFDRLAWTRDGRSLIFTIRLGNVSRVMRINAKGGQPEFTGLEVARMGTWSLSPDGQRLAYARTVTSSNELWAIDVSQALQKIH